MIKVAVFDVDGTLLSRDTNIIPQSAVDAICKMHDKGVKIVIATGRPRTGLQQIRNAGIPIDYSFSVNGACVYDEVNEKLLWAHPVSNENVEDMLAYFVNQHDCPVMLKFPSGPYSYNKHEEIDTFMTRRKVEIQLKESYNCDNHKSEPCLGGNVFASEEIVEGYRQSKQGKALDFVPFQPDKYDFQLHGVSKGEGLIHFTEATGYHLNECIAFGDADNDVEMIREAGIGVAMKQCSSALLEVCDYQTDDVMSDGIARALAHFNLY